ncbi:MAG: tetratricopeptide repeat protein [Planctomycetota bacterium]
MTDETAPQTPDPSKAPSAERPGDRIDRYVLLEPLGEGGMGSVWLAEQSEPIQRRVALKLIKRGMDTRQVVARFDAERQALALMDHPCIARVYEAGTTAAGRPFFVMEAVDGQPITDFCRETGLDLERRLALFVRVCDAVQHAHQRGVIHRDLKPSNILVSRVDGVPTPKVIDFGIAKATGGEGHEGTLLTEARQILGTPEYMAPEQAGMDSQGVDTRADVYSLGVLLYELLTGSRPLEASETTVEGLHALLRAVVEETPQRPSTRLATRAAAGGEAADVSVDRETRDRIEGELDWIVLKALEKERERRYGSAREFAADVQRFLDDEPVQAAPPSRSYRLRKFVRRNRLGVMSAAAIVLLFLAGSIGSGVGFWRAVEANAELDLAVEAERQRADELAAAIMRERARAAELERVASFQSSLLEGFEVEEIGRRVRDALLEALDPQRREAIDGELAPVNFTQLALDVLNFGLFDRMVASIEEEFADLPAVQDQLHWSTGRTMRVLGLPRASLEPLSRAYELSLEARGPDDPETLIRQTLLGSAHLALRQLERAEGLIVEARTRAEATAEAGSEIDLVTRIELARLRREEDRWSEARALLEPVAMLPLDPASYDQRIVSGRVAFATVLYEQSEYAAAEQVLGALIPIVDECDGAASNNAVAARTQLARVFQQLGREADALELFEQSYAATRALKGDDNTQALATALDLARAYTRADRTGEARELFAEIARLSGEVIGPGSRFLASARAGLALAELAEGRAAEAAASFGELVELYSQAGGAGDRDAQTARVNRSLALGRLGRHAERERTMREALALAESASETDPELRLSILRELASALIELGELDEADRLAREALAEAERVHGRGAPATISVRAQLVALLSARGDLEGALAESRAMLADVERVEGRRSKYLTLQNNIAELHINLGRENEALALHREVLAQRTALLGAEHADTLTSRFNLGSVLYRLGRFEETLSEVEPIVDPTRAVFGETHPLTLLVVKRLAQSYSALKRYDEEERWWRALYGPTLEAARESGRPTVDARFYFSRALARTGRYEESIEVADGLLALGPEEASPTYTVLCFSARLQQAQCRRWLGDDAAEREILEALLPDVEAAKIDPFVAVASARMGRNLLRAGQALEAERNLRTACERCASDPRLQTVQLRAARAGLGLALVRQARIDEGLPLLIEAVEWLLENQPPPADPRGFDDDCAIALEQALEALDAAHAADPAAGHQTAADRYRRLLDERS